VRNKGAVFEYIKKQGFTPLETIEKPISKRMFLTGFTLTELLVVVIILGILLAIGAPLLVKNIEKTKTGEAVTNLNLIRMAEKDYFLDNSSYTSDISQLIIDSESLNISGGYFDYTILSADANNFTAKATRKSDAPNPYAGDYYTIDENGAIDSSNGHFQL